MNLSSTNSASMNFASIDSFNFMNFQNASYFIFENDDCSGLGHERLTIDSDYDLYENLNIIDLIFTNGSLDPVKIANTCKIMSCMSKSSKFPATWCFTGCPRL